MGHHTKHAYRIIYETLRGTDFKRESYSKMAMEWFEWKAQEVGTNIPN